MFYNVINLSIVPFRCLGGKNVIELYKIWPFSEPINLWDKGIVAYRNLQSMEGRGGRGRRGGVGGEEEGKEVFSWLQQLGETLKTVLVSCMTAWRTHPCSRSWHVWAGTQPNMGSMSTCFYEHFMRLRGLIPAICMMSSMNMQKGNGGLWKPLYRVYAEGKITANFKRGTTLRIPTFPQRQSATAFGQWARASREDEPIGRQASLRIWHCDELPTWAVQWHDRAKWTNNGVCVHIVRVCPGLCLPVTECALACDGACVYQQDRSCCQSQGQLVIWSAASPVVVTAAPSHGRRRDARWAIVSWTQWSTLMCPVWEKRPDPWHSEPLSQCFRVQMPRYGLKRKGYVKHFSSHFSKKTKQNCTQPFVASMEA